MITHNSAGCSSLSALAAFVLILTLPGISAAQAATACDSVAAAKTEFNNVRREIVNGNSSVDEATFRSIARDYIALAEQCYQAKYGTSPASGNMIDEGGLFMTPSGASLSPAPGTAFGSESFETGFGTKWGAGSPFAGGTDVPGPRIPGGTVSYSYMADGVDLSPESMAMPPPPLPNVAITSLGTFGPCFLTEIEAGFAAWSAVADIQFTPLPDGGEAFDAAPSAHIRIGAHTIDGAFGVLAHAFFPPPNGVGAAGDLHFDSAEPWGCHDDFTSLDFGIVALHELGHAIGLGHEAPPPGGDIAVMNPSYNPSLVYGPLADDTMGAGEIYGAGGAATAMLNPNVGIGTDAPDSSLHVQDNKTGFPQLFHLENIGSDFAGFRFSTPLGAIDFNKAGGNKFRLNVVDGDTWELQLDPDGNLTVKGDVFSSTCGTPCAPDYVFAPDYELMPLDDLEAFIKRENHLPNVPSAEELTGPISLNKMQMRLLEKVEELTLYTLEQQKTIEDLKSRLEAIER